MPNGEVIVVTIDSYDHAIHSGRLRCLGCDAEVHFNQGTKSTCGDNGDPVSPHFHTNRYQKHIHEESGCVYASSYSTREDKQIIDKTKGYRINLNLGLIDKFNASSRYYKLLPDGRMAAVDEIASMETIGFGGPQDFAEKIKGRDAGRLRRSLVIHKDIAMPWPSFFLNPDSKADEVSVLLNYLEKHGKDTPVLYRVRSSNKPVFSRSNGVDNAYIQFPCAPVDLGDAGILYVKVHIENTPEMRKAGLVSLDLWKYQEPLILDFPSSFNSVRNGGRAIHYLQFKVISPEQAAVFEWPESRILSPQFGRVGKDRIFPARGGNDYGFHQPSPGIR